MMAARRDGICCLGGFIIQLPASTKDWWEMGRVESTRVAGGTSTHGNPPYTDRQTSS